MGASVTIDVAIFCVAEFVRLLKNTGKFLHDGLIVKILEPYETYILLLFIFLI